MRLFVALDLPEPMRGDLLDMQDDLGVGREVPEENLHLTLAFLGSCSEQEAEVLHEMLSEIRLPKVRLTVQGAALFGGSRHSFLAALVERVPELVSLQEKTCQAARMAGIALPRRRFKPHVTLVRFSRRLSEIAQSRIGAWLGAYGNARFAQAEAVRFSLYRSHLHEDGPVYEQLAEYPLWS